MKKIDTLRGEVGKIYNNLRIDGFRYQKRGRAVDLVCDCTCMLCGKKISPRWDSIMKGQKSCGCHRLVHFRGTKLYYVFRDMINRCRYRNLRAYKRYGGRGITVCDEWKESPKKFYDWAMSHGYKEGLHIDRIDNNKGYFPDNCRFVTVKENMRNKTNNHIIEYNGRKQCIKAWSDELHINSSVLYQRLKSGMCVDDAIEKPVNRNLARPDHKPHLITYNGETHSISEWGRITGTHWRKLQRAYRYGITDETIFKKKNEKGK